MKTKRLGVKVVDRSPNFPPRPLIQTFVEHHLGYSYSVPKPAEPGWTNFNVHLNITQIDRQTYEKLFDCDFVYTEMINNEGKIPDRQFIVDIVKDGIDGCTSAFHSRVEDCPLETYIVAYPGPVYLNACLNDAEHDYNDFAGV
jgi:hypothetical protein